MINKKIASLLIALILVLSSISVGFAVEFDLTSKITGDVYDILTWTEDYGLLLDVAENSENYIVEVGGKLYNIIDVIEVMQADPTITIEEVIKDLTPITEDPEEFKVISISKLEDIEVPFGTAVNDISLPNTVTATLDDEDATVVVLTIVWADSEDYDSEISADYVFTGTLTKSDEEEIEFIIPEDLATVTITVTVLEKVLTNVEKVEALIEALPEVEDVILDNAPEVGEARDAYEALTAEEQALVSNIEKLEALEAKLIALENEKLAEIVIEMIDALDPESVTFAEDVEAARAAFNDLKDAQKDLVTNYNKLVDAENSLNVLEVLEVSVIDETGVTVEFAALEAAIEGATVEVVNPAGEVVETEAVDIAAEATEATFTFVTPLEAVEEGVWTVNEVEYNVDLTAPEVTEVEVKDGAKALVVTLDEAVEETEEGSLKVSVKRDGIAIDFGKAVLSEDGLTVEVPSKDDTVIADGKYEVTVEGVADLAGNEIADKNIAEVTKKAVAEAMEITSVGLAKAVGQEIAYEVADNYGQKYTEATAIANGKITATAEVVATGLPLDVVIGSDKTVTIDASELAEDAEVKVVLTYKAGDVALTAEKTLTVGKAATAASIKDITLSDAKDSSDVVVDTDKDGFVLGKLAKFNLTANLLDQYNNTFDPSGADTLVTWTTSDKSVIAFDGVNSGKAVINKAAQKQTFTVGSVGTAKVTAYLANGEKAEYTVTVTLAGIKSISATDVTGAVNFEDKEVTTGFTFTDANDKIDTIEPLASQVTFEFKSGTDLTADDIVLETLANEDGTFKGLKVNAKKTGTYTVTMKYADKEADFTVTSTADTKIVKLAEIADFTTKAGAAEYKFNVKAMNKHNEEIGVDFADYTLTWYKEDGTAVSGTPTGLTVKMYDEDGAVVSATGRDVTKVGVTFDGSVDAATYTLKVEVDGTIAAQIVEVKTVKSALETITLANGITAADKFALNDAAKKYIEVELKDADGDVIFDTDSLTSKIMGSDGNAYTTANFVEAITFKNVDTDGNVTYGTKDATTESMVLQINAATASLDAGTYSVFVEYKTSADSDYVKSNVVPVVIGEERALETVTVAPEGVTVTHGSEAEVVVEARDQYGDLIAITPAEITLKAGATVVELGTGGVVAVKDAENADIDGKYTVPLKGIKAGTEEVTLEVKLGTVTKEVKVNATVKTAGDVARVEFTNKDLLHINDLSKSGKEAYNTVTLALVGYDADNTKLAVKASDFVWTTDLPDFIGFNATTGVISVTAAPGTEVATGTVSALQNGEVVGTFTVNFNPTTPKLTAVTVKEDAKVIKLAKGDTTGKALSGITLNLVYDFEGVSPATVTAENATWASNNPLVTIEGNTVKIDATAEVGDTATLTGIYNNKVVTLTVEVIPAS